MTSIGGEESDDDVELDDNSSIWQEVPLWLEDFSISSNKVDSDLKFDYKEEVKELKSESQGNSTLYQRRMSRELLF